MGDAIFAKGLCLEKIVCIFIVGAVLGDMIETIFCYAKAKKIMRRSSFVYGHMSIVWGLAFTIATIFAYIMKDTDIWFCYAAGVFWGGMFEYLCSLFTEKILGTKFWDYSNMPLNLHGRVNLHYCLYWGVATVLWISVTGPFFEKAIENIPNAIGIPFCSMALVYIIIDAAISALAIYRYAKRKRGFYSGSKWEILLDCRFPDCKMEELFPNIQICNTSHPVSTSENFRHAD